MGSSTHCYAKTIDLPRRRTLIAMGAMALGMLGPGARAQEATAKIAHARLWRNESGAWFLDADLNVERFPPTWEDLLQRGIEMPLRLELMLYRERWYWSDQLVYGKFWRIAIRYRPVTQDWLLSVGESTHAFYDRESLMQALRKIRAWPVAGDIFNPLTDVRAELKLSVDLTRSSQTVRATALGNDDYVWVVEPYRWYPWRER